MARLVSRAEFARMAGVSGSAITKACRDGSLGEACVGKRIDLDHPAARAYLASKGASPPPPPAAKAERPTTPARPRRSKTSESSKRRPKLRLVRDDGEDAPPEPPAPPPRKAPPPSPPSEGDGSPEDLEALAETLRPLLERFGTETSFKDWLDSLKRIEEIREKRLKNEETEGLLIRVEPVKVLVFAVIDSAQRRVLSDAPRTIVRRVYAMAGSGTPVEEAERTVRELLGSILRPVKATAERVLRNE